jgi:hypothetical protein
MQHGIWSAFQEIREANQNLSLTQTNGVVQVAEGEEAHVKFRHGRPRTQLTVNLLKEISDSGVQETWVRARPIHTVRCILQIRVPWLLLVRLFFLLFSQVLPGCFQTGTQRGVRILESKDVGLRFRFYLWIGLDIVLQGPQPGA